MKILKKSAVIVTAVLLFCAILFTGCPNSAGGGKPSASSTNSQNGGTLPGSGGGSGGNSGGGTPTPPPVQNVQLTVGHDGNIEKVEPQSLTVAKGTKWSVVKTKFAVTYKSGFEAAGWKLESAGGAYIDEETDFTKDTKVFAVSKSIGASTPETVTITVAGDTNVTVSSPNTLTVDKGVQWKDICAAAEGKVHYNAGYAAAGWKLESAGGADITDETVFNEPKTVVAVSKPKPAAPAEGQIRLTIRGDERIDEAASGFIDIDKGKTWAEVKDEVAAKVSLKSGWNKEYYGVYEWHLNDENGTPITDEYVFSADTTVYALTNYTKFWMHDNVIIAYMEEKPRGKIILPSKNGETKITIINGGAFSGCTSLTEVIFPAMLKEIKNGTWDYGAFKNCTSLRKLDFSACTQLTAIGDTAFYGCTEITTLDFSSCTQLTTIGKGAFANCTKLSGSVSLPANLKNIKGASFRGCDKIEELKVAPEHPYLSVKDGIVYDKNKTKLLCSIPKVTSAELPPGLKEIAPNAFDGSTHLTHVDFPSSLETIGAFAFRDCAGLTGILNLSGCTNLVTIGEWAFDECSSLEGVQFPASLTTIGAFAFRDCAGLTGILNLSGCTNLATIDYRAFDECSSLEGVQFPAALETIGTNAFANCKKMTGSLNLSGCTKLKKIDICTFANCGFTGILDLSGCTNLEEISEQAFYSCQRLNEVNLSGCTSLKTIHEEAFYGCLGKIQKYTVTKNSGVKEILKGIGVPEDKIKEVP